MRRGAPVPTAPWLMIDVMRPKLALGTPGILAVGANFTAIQRVWVVWQQNRAELRALRGPSAAAAGTDRPAAPQPVRAAMRRFFESLGKT